MSQFREKLVTNGQTDRRTELRRGSKKGRKTNLIHGPFVYKLSMITFRSRWPGNSVQGCCETTSNCKKTCDYGSIPRAC